MYKFDEDDLTAFKTLGETGAMTEEALYAIGEYVESLEGRVDVLMTELVGETSDSMSITGFGIDGHYRTGGCGYTNYLYETIPFRMLLDDDAIEKIILEKTEKRKAAAVVRAQEDAVRQIAADRKKDEEKRFRRFREYEAKNGEFKND